VRLSYFIKCFATISLIILNLNGRGATRISRQFVLNRTSLDAPRTIRCRGKSAALWEVADKVCKNLPLGVVLKFKRLLTTCARDEATRRAELERHSTRPRSRSRGRKFLAAGIRAADLPLFPARKVLSAGARNLRWTMKPQPAEERQRSLALALNLRWPARELLDEGVGGEGQESLG